METTDYLFSPHTQIVEWLRKGKNAITDAQDTDIARTLERSISWGEYHVLRLRSSGMSLQEIAEMYGSTRERIRQIEIRARSSIKRRLDSRGTLDT